MHNFATTGLSLKVSSFCLLLKLQIFVLLKNRVEFCQKSIGVIKRIIAMSYDDVQRRQKICGGWWVGAGGGWAECVNLF